MENIYFDEPRLKMTMFGRTAIRFASYCFYAIFSVAAFIFLMSDVDFLFWVGVFSTLFLFYRIIHLKQADAELFSIKNKITFAIEMQTNSSRKIN